VKRQVVGARGKCSLDEILQIVPALRMILAQFSLQFHVEFESTHEMNGAGLRANIVKLVSDHHHFAFGNSDVHRRSGLLHTFSVCRLIPQVLAEAFQKGLNGLQMIFDEEMRKHIVVVVSDLGARSIKRFLSYSVSTKARIA